MSVFENDGGNFNIPFPTMGGKVFWEELEARDGYRLQRYLFTNHCRILDRDDIRVAWGEEGPMRAEFRKLTEKTITLRAKYGDVIGIHRLGGLYDHYGVFESEDRVYEYAAETGDMGDAEIRVSTLKKFLGDQDSYFVLTFPESHELPGKLHMSAPGAAIQLTGSALGGIIPELTVLRSLIKGGDYHLYSPEETIQRARRRLGERKYNLAFNNCEHFAIWCKTGVHESHQVEAVLGILGQQSKNLISPFIDRPRAGSPRQTALGRPSVSVKIRENPLRSISVMEGSFMEENNLSVQSVQKLSEQFLSLLQGSGVFPDADLRDMSRKLEQEVAALLRSPKPQILVYGIYNSGKSTLVNALCGRKVAKTADRPMTDKITEYDNGKYILIDSPGIDAPMEHERIADAQLSKCHIILFVVSSKGGFESRENYVKMLQIMNRDVPFYIILNERGVALPSDPAERQKVQQQHLAELEGAQRKIIQNLVSVSGDANVSRKYDVIVLNAERAWAGVEEKNEKLVKASNITALRLRINDILEEKNALWLKAPLAALDACMSQAESKLYTQTGSHDYADDREVFRAKVTDARNRISDQIRNLVYSRFDSAYSYYCGTSSRQLDQIGVELTDEVQNNYNRAVEPLFRYVKETFPNLRKTTDGRFVCVPLNSSGAPVSAPAGKESYVKDDENFFASSDSPGASNVLEAAGAAALGASVYSAASALGSTAVGTAVTQAATVALGSTAVGAAAGVAGGLLSPVIATIPGVNIGAILGLVVNAIKSASRRKREEEERCRQMQEEIERANQAILNEVAEQARFRQDARAKANAILDDWAYSLRVAAEAQLDQIAATILQALDMSVMQQKQTEDAVQQTLRQLHTLREELAGLRIGM